MFLPILQDIWLKTEYHIFAFPLSSAALEWLSMLISTGRTPIRYDMVCVLLTMQVIIVMIFVFFSILCNKQ